jgi:hypothetical protein
MPMQECFVKTTQQLDSPGGVLFEVPADGPRSEIIALDRQSWTEARHELERWMNNGWHIMTLIQTRGVREWNNGMKQYTFKRAEDYLCAAFILHKDACVPFYRPGTVLEQWYLGVDLRFAKVLPERDKKILPLWQCDPRSCKLTALGATTLIDNGLEKKGPFGSSRTAIGRVAGDIINANKYGWQGIFM